MSDPTIAPARWDLGRTTLGVLIIVALLGTTIWIMSPFLAAIVWAAMIVVATWPVMRRLQRWLGGSRKWAVVVMTVALLLVLVVPLALAIGTIISNSGVVVEWGSSLQTFTMPPPPEWLANVPMVGSMAVDAWMKVAASGLPDVVTTVAPYATSALLWVAGMMRGIGWLLLEFLLTLAIAAVMYTRGEGMADALLRFSTRLGGDQGERAVRLAAQAIRGVALGVIVTAIIQAAITGLGLLITGVPFAGLLGGVAFVLCIAQIGPIVVLVPSIGWLFWQGNTGAGTVLLALSLVIMTLDNVLRPLLMTKGTDLPMLLMLMGVIGGLLAFGLIGIFIGPVVLAVSYTLFNAWIAEEQMRPPISTD